MIRWYGLVVVAGCAIVLMSCSWFGLGVGRSQNCAKQVVREYPSPSGGRKAIVYNMTCDNAPVMTYAEIHPSDDPKFMPSIFNAMKSTAQAGPFQWPELGFMWKSDTELWITYPAGYQIGCVGTPLRGVAVHCVER